MRVGLDELEDGAVRGDIFELEDSLVPDSYFFLRVDQLLVVFLLLVFLHVQQ